MIGGTENLKEGMKYALSDWKKLPILGIITLIGLLLTTFGASILTFTQITSVSHVSNPITHYLHLGYPINIILGIILTIIGILVCFLISGYRYRIIENSINNNEELPKFDNWAKMFTDGLRIFAVRVVYFILPVLLFLIGTSLIYSTIDVLSIIGTFLFIISMILIVIAEILVIMATNHLVANDGELSSIIEFRESINHIKNYGILKYIAMLIMTYLITDIVTASFAILGTLIVMTCTILVPGLIMLSAASIIVGVLISLFVTPYLTIFSDRVLGHLYQ